MDESSQEAAVLSRELKYKDMTKEQIMRSILDKQPPNYEIEAEEVLECMGEYAKDQVIAFENWRRSKENAGIQEVHDMTPEQLYQIFKQTT